jgi:hypothetical protein
MLYWTGDINHTGFDSSAKQPFNKSPTGLERGPYPQIIASLKTAWLFLQAVLNTKMPGVFYLQLNKENGISGRRILAYRLLSQFVGKRLT